MEFTRELAMKIIESKPVIDQALVPYKGIEVSYVGFTDADGEAFEWESGDEYAIVSFKAVNEYGFDLSVEDFKNEDFDSAVNHNLSMSMSVDKARNISVNAPGTLVCHFVKNKDGIDILVPKSYTPAVAIDSSKARRSLTDILAKGTVAVETEA